jgi:hypothetical protein
MSESARTSRDSVTRADMCEAVYRKVRLSRAESARLVELVLGEIADCLERGETVKLSAFGSFLVRRAAPGPKSEDGSRGADQTPPGDGFQAVRHSQEAARQRRQDIRLTGHTA